MRTKRKQDNPDQEIKAIINQAVEIVMKPGIGLDPGVKVVECQGDQGSLIMVKVEGDQEMTEVLEVIIVTTIEIDREVAAEGLKGSTMIMIKLG